MKKILLVLLLLNSYFLVAQNEPTEPFFFFLVDNQPYEPLVNSISLNDGIPYDDPDFIVPIGFDFNYLGDDYDSLAFGGIDGYGAELVFFKSIPGYPMHLISPYMMDVIDGGADGTEALSDVRYWLEGDPGNRTFFLEWSNVGFFNEDEPYSMRMNFMMRLFEGSNAIEFHYGQRNDLDHDVITDYDGVPVVFTKNVDQNEMSLEKMQGLSGNPADPTLLEYPTFPDFLMATHLTETPAENTVYRFNPYSVNIEESTKEEWKVYPNPARDQVFVELQEASFITLWNATGEKVYDQMHPAGFSPIQVMNFSEGLYFLKKQNGEKELVKKLIIN